MSTTEAKSVADATGLTEGEVAERRARGEGNTSPAPTTRSYRQIFRENVFTFVNLILFVLGVALLLVGRPLDALVSVSVISLNTAVSVFQEIRAKRALDRIALLTAPKARALRSGELVELSPEQLMLGDVLQVGPGDQVVLDGRLLTGRLDADESLLTGESELVSKKPGDPLYSGWGEDCRPPEEVCGDGRACPVLPIAAHVPGRFMECGAGRVERRPVSSCA